MAGESTSPEKPDLATGLNLATELTGTKSPEKPDNRQCAAGEWIEDTDNQPREGWVLLEYEDHCQEDGAEIHYMAVPAVEMGRVIVDLVRGGCRFTRYAVIGGK